MAKWDRRINSQTTPGRGEIRPFPGESDVQITFAPEGDGTKVTWAMQAQQPYMGKLVGLFMDCEKMCGDSFLEGLANLKKVVEQPAGAKG